MLLAAALAALGFVAVATMMVSSARAQAETALMDKQQAAWWGFVARHRARGRGRGRVPKQLAISDNRKSKLDEIHGLLDKALGMMGSIGKHQQILAGSTPSSAAQDKRMAMVKADIEKVTPGKGEEPKCFKYNHFDGLDRTRALRRMTAAADNLAAAYPAWAKSQSIGGHGQDGEWDHERGPPYVQRITMYVGLGVDTLHNGNLVRRILVESTPEIPTNTLCSWSVTCIQKSVTCIQTRCPHPIHVETRAGDAISAWIVWCSPKSVSAVGQDPAAALRPAL